MKKRITCLVVLFSMTIGCFLQSPVQALADSNSAYGLLEKQNIQMADSSEEVQSTEEINVTGHWTDDKKDLSYNAKYRDDYFVNDSSVTQGGLAKLSMLGAASAYEGKNAKSFLEQCGFVYKYVTVKLKEKDNDHVSYGIGYKKIGDYTLVAVLVRGTKGNYEWVSNFNLGTNANHIGFKNAKNEMKSSINSYLKKEGITGNIKWWITGHSRGAAVANMYAKDITLIYGKANVYAYTFATPRVSIDAFKDGFENIKNYLNPGDFVTEVAPKKWGYKRWGQDIVLGKEKAKMKKLFKSIKGVKYGGFTKKGKEKLLNAFLSYCGKNVKQYYKLRIYGTKISIKPSEFCQRGLAYALLNKDTYPLKFAEGVALCLLVSKRNPHAAIVFGSMIKTGIISNEFAHAHCPASYMCWVDAMYPDTSEDDGGNETTEPTTNPNIPADATAVHIKEGEGYRFVANENLDLYKQGVGLVNTYNGFVGLADYCSLSYTPMSKGDAFEVYVVSGEIDVWSKGKFSAEKLNHDVVRFIVLSGNETCIVKSKQESGDAFSVFWDDFKPNNEGKYYMGSWTPVYPKGNVFGDDVKEFDGGGVLKILYMHYEDYISNEVIHEPNTAEEESYVYNTFSVSTENMKVKTGEEKKIEVVSNIPGYQPRLEFFSKNNKVSISEDGVIKRTGDGKDIVIVRDGRTEFFKSVNIS